MKDVASRRRNRCSRAEMRKKKRKEDRKVINPTVEILSLRIQFVPGEQTQSVGCNGFQPLLTCFHEYHFSHHKKYTTSIFICTLFAF